jgi:hypothetical protein
MPDDFAVAREKEIRDCMMNYYLDELKRTVLDEEMDAAKEKLRGSVLQGMDFLQSDADFLRKVDSKKKKKIKEDLENNREKVDECRRIALKLDAVDKLRGDNKKTFDSLERSSGADVSAKADALVKEAEKKAEEKKNKIISEAGVLKQGYRLVKQMMDIDKQLDGLHNEVESLVSKYRQWKSLSQTIILSKSKDDDVRSIGKREEGIIDRCILAKKMTTLGEKEQALMDLNEEIKKFETDVNDAKIVDFKTEIQNEWKIAITDIKKFRQEEMENDSSIEKKWEDWDRSPEETVRNMQPPVMRMKELLDEASQKEDKEELKRIYDEMLEKKNLMRSLMNKAMEHYQHSDAYRRNPKRAIHKSSHEANIQQQDDNAAKENAKALDESTKIYSYDISWIRGVECGDGLLSTRANVDEGVDNTPAERAARSRSNSLRRYTVVFHTKTKDGIFQRRTENKDGFSIHHLVIKCKGSPSMGGYKIIADTEASMEEKEAYRQQLLKSTPIMNGDATPLPDPKYSYVRSFGFNKNRLPDQTIIWPYSWSKTVNFTRHSDKEGSLECVRMSWDGGRVAVGTWSGYCLIFSSELPNVRKLSQMAGHAGGIMSIAWCKGDTHIATASTDTTVRVWDSNTGTPKVLLAAHGGIVQKVDWCPVKNHLASGGYSASDRDNDAMVYVWNMRDWETRENDFMDDCVPVIIHGGKDVLGLAWSPDGEHLAVSTKNSLPVVFRTNNCSVHAWSVEKKKWPTHEKGLHIHGIAWSHSGHTLFTGGSDRNIMGWEFPSGKMFLKIENAFHNQVCIPHSCVLMNPPCTHPYNNHFAAGVGV